MKVHEKAQRQMFYTCPNPSALRRRVIVSKINPQRFSLPLICRRWCTLCLRLCLGFLCFRWRLQHCLSSRLQQRGKIKRKVRRKKSEVKRSPSRKVKGIGQMHLRLYNFAKLIRRHKDEVTGLEVESKRCYHMISKIYFLHTTPEL